MNRNTKFFMGIDVSKPFFDASLMAVIDYQKQPIETARFENSTEGMKSFEKWLKTHKAPMDENALLVIENTGIYHRIIWSFCSKKNLPIHIGNAAHIKWSFGIARGKNDKIDSIRLCQYATVFMPPKGFPTVQMDMFVAEHVGLYKLDILSQRGLGHIKESLRLIKENQGVDVNIHDFKKFKKDKRVSEQIKQVQTIGCFYIESPAMRQLLKKLECDDYVGSAQQLSLQKFLPKRLYLSVIKH